MDRRTHKSDIYFEAFVSAMQSEVGGIYFKNGVPVIVCEIEIIDTFLKAVVIKYLINNEQRNRQEYNETTVDSVEDFRATFLSKEEYERQLEILKELGFNEKA